MRTYEITTALGLPVVTAVIAGPKCSKRVQLVFDSGSVSTQVHIGTMRAIGFDFSKRKPDLTMQGVTGPAEEGFSTNPNRFFVLGFKFQDPFMAAFDFKDWAKKGIDGLLGWDLIETFHFEVDGPRKEIRIF